MLQYFSQHQDITSNMKARVNLIIKCVHSSQHKNFQFILNSSIYIYMYILHLAITHHLDNIQTETHDINGIFCNALRVCILAG